MKKCQTCKDNAGFIVRACPGCAKQKRLDGVKAKIYNQPVGRFFNPHLYKLGNDYIWRKLKQYLQNKENLAKSVINIEL